MSNSDVALILRLGGEDASDVYLLMARWGTRSVRVAKGRVIHERRHKETRLKRNSGIRDLLFSEVRPCELDRARMVMG